MPRPRIYSIAFELTTRCNLRCAHCYNANHGSPSNTTFETQRLIDRIDKILDCVDLQYATLTGGEPLLHPGLLPIIYRLDEARVPCQIISNGLLLDDRLAERLKKAGVQSIQLSLHSADPKRHDQGTGVSGSYERTKSAAMAALRAGLQVTGCIVVTRRNSNEVGKTLSLWKSLGIQRVALSRFSPSGLATPEVKQLLPSLADVLKAFDQALPFAKNGLQVYCTMPVPPCALDFKQYAPIRFGCCSIGTSMQEFALGPDGALRNCTLHHHPLGDVMDILDTDVNLAALFAHEDVTTYREHPPAFCKECLYASTCGGGCGAAALSVYGSRDLPDPFLWQHFDDGTEQ